MAIEVTARHLHTVKDVEEYARERAAKVIEEFPRVEHIHVILDQEKHRQIAEVVVQARNHVRIESAESSDNLRASVDRAVEKAEKQLRRWRDKAVDHKPAMKQNAAELEKGGAGGRAQSA
ncbi:MAG: ribosome-associated translation inhibitor RaiA [Lentisphaerae bacterium]|nr:ribosome-associated translation inhibitor RaiA [Lentisphaerota bacterium]